MIMKRSLTITLEAIFRLSRVALRRQQAQEENEARQLQILMASANQAQSVSKITPRLNTTPTAVPAIELTPEPSDAQSHDSAKKRKRSADNDSSPEIALKRSYGEGRSLHEADENQNQAEADPSTSEFQFQLLTLQKCFPRKPRALLLKALQDGFAVEKSPEFEIEIWNTSFNSNATLFTQADLEALVAINETLSTFNDDLQIQSLYPDLYRLSVKCEILAGQLNLTVFNLLENNDNNDEIIANQIQALQTYSFQLSRNFLRQSFERNFNLIQYEIEEMQQLISKSIINFNKTIGSFPVYNDRISNTVVEILSEAKIKSNNISNTYADKLSSLGECSVIYDVYQESVDFLCAKVSHAINLFWISLGFASIVIIIMIFFGHKFHKTDVFW
ncbi:unnamed protein product [Oikopleura dioica]|uniref:Uncharacterized protein n=1 Tax=Oikopleura dioica TaxID=34765 RepID=E4YX46_OIKDI|nr:unnamed protein product [Oikopleura dioica]